MIQLKQSLPSVSDFLAKCKTGCTDELNTDTPHLELVKPCSPLDSRNLAYRKNWTVFLVNGIDEAADIELSTESQTFQDGVFIRGKRKTERTITIGVRICPCEGCSITMPSVNCMKS